MKVTPCTTGMFYTPISISIFFSIFFFFSNDFTSKQNFEILHQIKEFQKIYLDLFKKLKLKKTLDVIKDVSVSFKISLLNGTRCPD